MIKIANASVVVVVVVMSCPNQMADHCLTGLRPLPNKNNRFRSGTASTSHSFSTHTPGRPSCSPRLRPISRTSRRSTSSSRRCSSDTSRCAYAFATDVDDGAGTKSSGMKTSSNRRCHTGTDGIAAYVGSARLSYDHVAARICNFVISIPRN